MKPWIYFQEPAQLHDGRVDAAEMDGMAGVPALDTGRRMAGMVRWNDSE